MPKLPQVSGDTLIRLLESLGYEVVRQRGSHARLARTGAAGVHRVVAKGTLSDILSQVSLRVGVAKEELIERLR